MVIYEISAELCFPINEVFSLAMVLTFEGMLRWAFMFISGFVALDVAEYNTNLLITHTIIMLIFLIMIVSSIVILHMKTFENYRFKADTGEMIEDLLAMREQESKHQSE